MKQIQAIPGFIIEHFSEAVYVVDADANFIDSNTAGYESLGYSRDELTDFKFYDIDQGLTSGKWHSAWQEYKVLGSVVSESVFQAQSGDQFPVEIRTSFFLHDNREYLCIFVSDITERKKTELEIEQSRREWNYAMDFFDDPIYLLDLDRRVVQANQAFYRLVHASEADIIGRHITEILHPEGEAVPCPVCMAQEEKRDASIIMEPDHPDNPAGIPIEVICRIIRKPDGDPTGILMTIHDLSRAREVKEQLIQSQAVFKSTIEGIMITDLSLEIIAVNPAFTAITGYTEEDALGNTPRLLQSKYHDEAFYRELWSILKKNGSWQGEVWNRRKNGEVYPEWLTINIVRDDDGNPVNYIGVFSDISQLKQSQTELEFMAHHDPLTALPNRLLFHDRLKHAIDRARRNNNKMAVLFLDLDRFKHINDSLGHTIGDQMLMKVSQRFKHQIREEDTVARLGGDEFVILIEDLDDSDMAAVLAEKISKSLEEPFSIHSYELVVGVSIGISLFPRDGTTVEELLRNADSAMYHAKELGRNTYQFYTQALTDHALEHLLLGGQLRKAIEQDELVLYYQPQVDLKSGSIIGIEVLVRWQHPEQGMIMPEQFVYLAEETNLIIPLGEWVLHHACAQAQAWLGSGIDFGHISVNIAGPQILRSDLLEVVGKILDETGLPAERLELEITETFIMAHKDRVAIDLLLALRKLGISLAIDDFGTGYSSLAYLKQLPVNKLKIDRSFVKDLPDDENDAAITRAVIALGHSMLYTIVAEGVESEAQRNFLVREGCEHGQGFYYSEPVDAEGLVALIQNQEQAD
ncbi:MAG: EAL domain-containing protein [Gammaproteobacteria bacterium]|nr:EAL domain-containing protein [Gammaproteobacteria bacterium]